MQSTAFGAFGMALGEKYGKKLESQGSKAEPPEPNIRTKSNTMDKL